MPDLAAAFTSPVGRRGDLRSSCADLLRRTERAARRRRCVARCRGHLRPRRAAGSQPCPRPLRAVPSRPAVRPRVPAACSHASIARLAGSPERRTRTGWIRAVGESQAASSALTGPRKAGRQVRSAGNVWAGRRAPRGGHYSNAGGLRSKSTVQVYRLSVRRVLIGPERRCHRMRADRCPSWRPPPGQTILYDNHRAARRAERDDPGRDDRIRRRDGRGAIP